MEGVASVEDGSREKVNRQANGGVAIVEDGRGGKTDMPRRE